MLLKIDKFGKIKSIEFCCTTIGTQVLGGNVKISTGFDIHTNKKCEQEISTRIRATIRIFSAESAALTAQLHITHCPCCGAKIEHEVIDD